MYPRLSVGGEYYLDAYGTFLPLAFIVVTALVVVKGQKLCPPLSKTPGIGLTVFVGAIAGARAFHVLQFHRDGSLWEAVFTWRGGFVFYGGLVGGIAALFLYAARTHRPFLPLMDLLALFVPLGEAIARIGCFLSGCCWGRVTALPWGVRFPMGSPAWYQHVKQGLIDTSVTQSLPVHPTQLYMVAATLLIFAVLWIAYPRRRNDGEIALLYLMLYGGLRALVEHFRGDSGKPVLNMTLSQAISVSLCLLAASVLVLWQVRNTVTKTCAGRERNLGGRPNNLPVGRPGKPGDIG